MKGLAVLLVLASLVCWLGVAMAQYDQMVPVPPQLDEPAEPSLLESESEADTDLEESEEAEFGDNENEESEQADTNSGSGEMIFRAAPAASGGVAQTGAAKGGPVNPKMIKGKPPGLAPPPSAKTNADCRVLGNCLEAELPAMGEQPGDKSPVAVYKKKMEDIAFGIGKRTRSIGNEQVWIDQVEAIIKQYQSKLQKVKQHVRDQKKQIRDLLRKRRQLKNEKKKKELESKLKIATKQLTGIKDALDQVKNKEQDFSSHHRELRDHITQMQKDLAKLKGKPNPPPEGDKHEEKAAEEFAHHPKLEAAEAPQPEKPAKTEPVKPAKPAKGEPAKPATPAAPAPPATPAAPAAAPKN